VRYVAGLAAAEAGLIFVRATSANSVHVWTTWWWVWLLATVAVAWFGGIATHITAVQQGWMRPVRRNTPHAPDANE
jgi:hypothetical protein